MTYLDVWKSGTFLLYSCKAAFWIQETSLRLSDVECSVVLRSVFVIGSALAYLLFFRECATPALVLQATNTGVRRPGYEAKYNILCVCFRLQVGQWLHHHHCMLIFHILKHNMLCQQVILLLNMEKVIKVRAQIRYCITVISETWYRQFSFH